MPIPVDDEHGLPPGPRSPAVWQLLRYSHSPLPFLEGCARRYGDPFTIRIAGYGQFVMLADPPTIREVFRADPQVLHSGEANEFLSVTVGENSVLVLDDEPHARQRRILLPPLKGERMRSFFDAMVAATLDEARAWPLGQTIRMEPPMRAITARVILRAVLGLQPGAELTRLEALVHNLLATTRTRYSLIMMKLTPQRLLRNVPGVPFFKQLRELDRAIHLLAAARRQLPPERRGDNVLADLLAAAHDDGRPLDDAEIRDAVVTILVAGHDTTAIALAWALEQIVPRADVVGRIVAELTEITSGQPLRAEHLPRLTYLDAAIREALRMRTILPFVVRTVKRTFAAGGREYSPGVTLCPASHLVHRRDDLYPQPGEFRPERFLERTYAGHEWFPFGGGNRTCLGMAFALYEMKVVLATLFSRVELTRPTGAHSHAVRRGIALAPHDGARMIVTRRR